MMYYDVVQSRKKTTAFCFYQNRLFTNINHSLIVINSTYTRIK